MRYDENLVRKWKSNFDGNNFDEYVSEKEKLINLCEICREILDLDQVVL